MRTAHSESRQRRLGNAARAHRATNGGASAFRFGEDERPRRARLGRCVCDSNVTSGAHPSPAMGERRTHDRPGRSGWGRFVQQQTRLAEDSSKGEGNGRRRVGSTGVELYGQGAGLHAALDLGQLTRGAPHGGEALRDNKAPPRVCILARIFNRGTRRLPLHTVWAPRTLPAES